MSIGVRISMFRRPVIVVRPAPDLSRGRLDVLAGCNRAKAEGVRLCLWNASGADREFLASLVPAEVATVPVRGLAGVWLRAAWSSAVAVREIRARLARGVASFAFECHRELRRQAGDERLPVDVRGQLRALAHRALTAAERSCHDVLPRRLLREPGRICFAPQKAEELEAVAAARGLVNGGGPIVAVQISRRPDTVTDAARWLAAEGYTVVRIGPGEDPIRLSGIVECHYSAGGSSLLDAFVLLSSRFVVCDSLETRHLAYLTNTPSLLLNAQDPFSGYPVPRGSRFTLCTAIDLESGCEAGIGAMLEEQYYRRFRHIGFRVNDAAQVWAAVREMVETVEGDRQEQPAQSCFRRLVVAAGERLARSVQIVRSWGPDNGFIGDGCLASWQAEQVR